MTDVVGWKIKLGNEMWVQDDSSKPAACAHSSDAKIYHTRNEAFSQASTWAGWPDRRLVRVTRRKRSSESALVRNVREFMTEADQSVISDGQTVPTDDVVRQRLSFIAEEFFELLEACMSDNVYCDIHVARKRTRDAIETIPLTVSLVDVADALADLRYVIVGTDLAFGIPTDAVDAEVHRSNMTKRPFKRDANGKVVKPDTYEPPDIEGVLRKLTE